MANFKNSAYSSTLKGTSSKDVVSHYEYKKQSQAQDRLINQWLQFNPKLKKKFKQT